MTDNEDELTGADTERVLYMLARYRAERRFEDTVWDMLLGGDRGAEFGAGEIMALLEKLLGEYEAMVIEAAARLAER